MFLEGFFQCYRFYLNLYFMKYKIKQKKLFVLLIVAKQFVKIKQKKKKLKKNKSKKKIQKQKNLVTKNGKFSSE